MKADLPFHDVHALARELLGATITHRAADGVVAVRVVEVEAYGGREDPASHAFRGMTPRNASMFGPPGRVYVYRHMGLHHCMNVVCYPEGRAGGVLLRAGEVTVGRDVAYARRTAVGVCRADRDLARGPGRFTVALGVSRDHDGAVYACGDAGGPLQLSVASRVGDDEVATGPRIGVGALGSCPEKYPWRYWVRGHRCVSASR